MGTELTQVEKQVLAAIVEIDGQDPGQAIDVTQVSKHLHIDRMDVVDAMNRLHHYGGLFKSSAPNSIAHTVWDVTRSAYDLSG